MVVVDLKDDRRFGFPSQMDDDPLLTIVMPPTHGEPYPFAEERRLFYVALTRARRLIGVGILFRTYAVELETVS